MFTTPSRPTLRHTGGVSAPPSRLTRTAERVGSLLCSCDLRSFVLLVGIIIVLANVALLVQLDPTAGSLEHRPSGGPIEGTDIHTQAHPTRAGGGGGGELKLLSSNRGTNVREALRKKLALTEESPGSDASSPSKPKRRPPSASDPSPSTLHAIWSRPASNDCERQFGNGFINVKQICERTPAAGGDDTASEMECKQNPLTGSTYCDARNLRLDLTKISVAQGGEPIESVRGRSEDAEFARYSRGAFSLSCTPSPAAAQQLGNREFFQHHLGDVLQAMEFAPPAGGRGAVANSPPLLGSGQPAEQGLPPSPATQRCSGTWITEPVLFITRYEYANLYHSMGDFYNAYQTQWMSDIHSHLQPGEAPVVHVVFLDGHSAGALDEVWTKLFGEHVTYVSGLPRKYGGGGGGTTFCFRRALFVSPAYKCALSVDMMSGGLSPSGCIGDGTGAAGGGAATMMTPLASFSDAFMRAYSIDTLTPSTLFPPGQATSRDLSGKEILPRELDLEQTPLVLIVFRRDYLAHPRLATLQASRKITNEDDVLAIATRMQGKAHVIGVDFAKLSVQQQLMLVRLATVFVGIHGAGLSYALMLSPASTLLELMPPEYSGRPHFRYFAQWAGRNYETMVVSGDAGKGHTVEAPVVETILRQILDTGTAGAASSQQGARPMGNGIDGRLPHGVVKTTFGWKRSRPGAKDTDDSDSPSTPLSSDRKPSAPTRTPGDPYTPGMLALPLPRSPTVAELDSGVADLGADLGASQNGGHRLCVIVPFRDSSSQTSQGANRTGNLMEMIPHMIAHLENVGMKFVRDFEMIVVEQTDGRIFNKGALFNIGYIMSKKAGCDYAALHDVDQLPISPTNRYNHPSSGPVHLCSASSQYGYQTLYGTMVGGALLITMEHYEQVNGYSNFYWGWGQEDDDFYYRLAAKFGTVNRLAPEDGRYRAMSHPRVQGLDETPVFSKGTQHLTETRMGTFDTKTDGISNLQFRLQAVEKWEKWPRGVRKFVAELTFENMPKDLSGRTE